MTDAERIAVLEERLDLMVDVVQAQQDQIDQLRRVLRVVGTVLEPDLLEPIAS